MDPVLTGALISGGASLVNSIASLFGQSGAAHYQRRNMQYASQLQHDENVFWADYNKPENQMSRLTAAGLNPNLVYGSGATATSQGSVSPNGAAPMSQFQFGLDLLSLMNLKAQKEKLDAEKKKTLEEAKGVALDNRKKAAQTPEYLGWLENKKAWSDYLNSVSEREKNQSITLLNDTQRELAQVQANIMNELGYQSKELENRNKALEGDILQIQKEKLPEKMAADIGCSYASAQKFFADAAAAMALKNVYDSTVNKYEKEIVGVKLENMLKVLRGKHQSMLNWILDYSKYGVVGNEYINGITKLVHGGNEAVSGLVGGGFMIP